MPASPPSGGPAAASEARPSAPTPLGWRRAGLDRRRRAAAEPPRNAGPPPSASRQRLRANPSREHGAASPRRDASAARPPTPSMRQAEPQHESPAGARHSADVRVTPASPGPVDRRATCATDETSRLASALLSIVRSYLERRRPSRVAATRRDSVAAPARHRASVHSRRARASHCASVASQSSPASSRHARDAPGAPHARPSDARVAASADCRCTRVAVSSGLTMACAAAVPIICGGGAAACQPSPPSGGPAAASEARPSAPSAVRRARDRRTARPVHREPALHHGSQRHASIRVAVVCHRRCAHPTRTQRLAAQQLSARTATRPSTMQLVLADSHRQALPRCQPDALGSIRSHSARMSSA